MNKIRKHIDYLQIVFATNGWWYAVPFAACGLACSLCFFCYAPVYLLLDYLQRQIKKLLYGDNEGISTASQCVKFILGFAFYFNFAVTVIIAVIPLWLLYFLSACLFFVSSLGKIRENLFGFDDVD